MANILTAALALYSYKILSFYAEITKLKNHYVLCSILCFNIILALAQ